MPNINPKVPGDQFYPTYSRIVTLTADKDVKKGCLYVIMNEAPDVNRIPNGRRVSFVSGKKVDKMDTKFPMIFQPLCNSKARQEFQCFYDGSRVGLRATAGIKNGDMLQWDATNEMAKPSKQHNKDIGSSCININENIGCVVEIYTKVQLGMPKSLTDTNDVIVAELCSLCRSHQKLK